MKSRHRYHSSCIWILRVYMKNVSKFLNIHWSISYDSYLRKIISAKWLSRWNFFKFVNLHYIGNQLTSPWKKPEIFILIYQLYNLRSEVQRKWSIFNIHNKEITVIASPAATSNVNVLLHRIRSYFHKCRKSHFIYVKKLLRIQYALLISFIKRPIWNTLWIYSYS